MKELVLVRIDDRLIHGQIVTQWMGSTHGTHILIVDDELVNNSIMSRMLKAVAPPGISVDIQTVEQAKEYLKSNPLEKEKIVVLVKIPQVLESLIDSGVVISSIILGGMGMAPNRKKFNKNVAASKDEIDCMKRIVEKGVSMYYQLVPSDSPVDVKNYF